MPTHPSWHPNFDLNTHPASGLGAGYENLPPGFSLETILIGVASNESAPYPGVPPGGANHAMRLYGDYVLKYTGKTRPPSNVDAKNRYLGAYADLGQTR